MRTWLGMTLAVVLVAGTAARAEDKPPAMSAEGKKAHDEAVKKALDDFKKTLREAKNDNEQASAIYRLGQAERDLKIVSTVAPYLTGTGDMSRGEAMTAIKVYRRERTAAQLLIAAVPACKNSPSQTEKLLGAMGAVGHESVIPVLLEHLKDNNDKVAAAAAHALADVNSAAVIDPLMTALKRLEREKDGVQVGGVAAGGDRYRLISPAVLETLKTVTGQKLATYADYEKWWEQNKATFKTKPEEEGKWHCAEHK